jgi:hypothetical protein
MYHANSYEDDFLEDPKDPNKLCYVKKTVQRLRFASRSSYPNVD